jgi:alkylated DNA repair protein alkB homolog 1
MISNTQDLLNPNSAAYKKARKLHKKTTKNRSETIEAEWTPFRAAEKRYKARFPPPNLSDVLDLALLDDSRLEEVEHGWWRGTTDAVNVREVNLKVASQYRRAYVFPEIPGMLDLLDFILLRRRLQLGLVLLPHFVSEDAQRKLAHWALRDHARPPNDTNLDTHYYMPSEGIWSAYLSDSERTIQPRASKLMDPMQPTPERSGPRELISNTAASPAVFAELANAPKPPALPSSTVTATSCSALLTKLRWANIGWFYHWGTKQYDFAKGKQSVDPIIRNLCKEAVSSVPWETVFEGDSYEGWGENGPDWHQWDETYGAPDCRF